MRRRGAVPILQLLSLGLIFASAALSGMMLVRYSRMRAAFPTGMIVAGVPVGGLDQKEAADHLTQVYGLPVELHYDDAVIQMKPATAGFELDLAAMIAAADLQRVNQPFWTAFWDFLWNRLPPSTDVPLSARISKERLRDYLENEIAKRYDKSPVPAMSLSGSANFTAGQPGTTLDIDRAIILIDDALRSPTNRAVNLTYSSNPPPRPSLQNLQVLMQRMIEVSGFDGLVEIFLLDLQTRQELHFAYQDGGNIPPDISFTAASAMKIPIMASAFRRYDEPAPQRITDLMELMIERSENDPADALMEQIGGNLGPLKVTEDMQTIGLQNSFIAGFFFPGAPLLQRIETPANQRIDIDLEPDPYNQTTSSEAGMMLDDIYQCAESGGGTLVAAFPGEISQNECRLMITYLTRNRIGVLIQAGLPEGTRVAHKHGWITEGDGLIHTMSDGGIVYTPGGNYILTIYVYHPVQLVFDPTNLMVAELSTVIYNYFNLAGQ